MSFNFAPDVPARPADLLAANVLPDSRPKVSRGARQLGGSWWRPIFCANCGCDGGYVPEENCTFAYWVCTPCYNDLGDVVNTYVMPDEVMWEKIKQEQLATYGRLLSNAELVQVEAADATPLAKLLKASGRPLTGG